MPIKQITRERGQSGCQPGKRGHDEQCVGVVFTDWYVLSSEIIRLNALVGFPIALYEANTDMRSYLTKYDVGISIEELAAEISSPDVAGTYKGLVLPEKLPGPDGLVEAAPIYEAAIKTHRPMLIQVYEKVFSDNKLDALVFPTTPAVAKIANENSSSLENFGLFIQNTDPGSDAGMPGLSIPMGLAKDNLPAGLEIDGLPGSDLKILSIGLALEEILRQ